MPATPSIQPESAYRPYDHLTGAEAAMEFPALTPRLLRTLRSKNRLRYYVIGGRAYYRWIDLYEFTESCVASSNR